MKTEIKVEGMTCGHCTKAVHNLIAELQGVQNVEVNLESSKAIVEFDGTIISSKEIVEAINQTHYSASL
jgi:copper ion binding protein